MIPATYRSEWKDFTAWCGAYRIPELPADPVTVAQFLEFDDTIKLATKRRRVAAINAVHRAANYTAPGTATAVRALLSERNRQTEAAHQAIRGLPVTGWPAGLFGRRDALVLMLVCVLGVPAAAVGDLTCGDITVTRDGRFRVGAGHGIEMLVDSRDHFGPLPVWARWARIQNVLARRPSPAALLPVLVDAPRIDEQAPPILKPPGPPHRPDDALLPAFDRWGHLHSLPGRDDEGLSTRAVNYIVSTHLRGRGRPNLTRETWAARILEQTKNAADAEQVMIPPAPPLQDVYLAGLAAKSAAADELSEVDDTFTEIDRRAQELLERTERLLATMVGE